jgi:dTDP-L-rhamnose 4-epimerase
MQVLVIGGAGFVGSHTVDALLQQGHSVRVADNLDPQVHPTGEPPEHLNRAAEFVRADLRDIEALRKSLVGVDAVFFLAGAVGVGDSMYRIRHYAESNLMGTANFLEILANDRHSIQKVVLSSSVTVYGEGQYLCAKHGIVFPALRSPEQIAEHQWEPECAVVQGNRKCGQRLQALPINEEKPLAPQSIYAITKQNQEQMFLTVGRTYRVPVAVLRYFNVFGARQALSNPYTGVAKIFATSLARGESPILYEDGLQSRDFVHVRDVVQANLLALEKSEANHQIFNVGTGRPTSVMEVATALAKILKFQGKLNPSNRCRAGDVRHCWADISKIRKRLGYEPRSVFPVGLEDVVEWSASGEGQSAKSDEPETEMNRRGLIS